MTTIKPILYDDLNKTVGPPGETDHLVKRPFPFKLYLNGNKNMPCNNFYGNKYIAEAVLDSFREILDVFGVEFIRNNGLDSYGGCYNYRTVRGTVDKLSVHSWGMAIDYLPEMGKLGMPSMIPYNIVEIFKSHGFIWGGDWKRKDGMHFSAVME